MGLILRRLRLARGLTQKNLARRVAGGVDTTYIGKIERGDQLPSLKVLLRLSKALGVLVVHADKHTAIPLPMPQGRAKD